MVDLKKLKALMVLRDYTQETLTAAAKAKGYKTSKNTINAKVTGRSKMTCEDADMFIDLLDITDPVERAAIFLA